MNASGAGTPRPSSSATTERGRPRPRPASSSASVEVREPESRGSLVPFVGVAVLFVLVVLTLHLSSVLRRNLRDELASRLRISAELVNDELGRATAPPDVSDPAVLGRLEEIRRSTSVSEILVYDQAGDLVGGATSAAFLGAAIPRTIRVGTAAPGRPADPGQREPERDVTGGLTLVVPLADAAGGGALLTRIDPAAQGGLPAIDFLFQVAKALAAVITAAGLLILLRWVARGGDVAPRAAPVPASDVGMVLGTVKDVMSTLKENETEYRDRWTAAEADAETQRRRSDLIVESISSGLVAFDPSGRITMFNRAAERIFGFAARNVVGRSVDEVFGEDDPFRGLSAAILHDNRPTLRREVERSVPGRDDRWLAVSSSVVRDDRGVSQGGMFLVDDVTETKTLRDAAGLKDRLSAVGEMSAGIAHEIKNSLHALMGHANLLKEDHPGDDPPFAVRGILSEVRALESMVRGVLEFSKPSRLARSPANVNELLKDTAESVRERAIRSGVEFRYEFASDLAPVSVDAQSVRRVFLNCVLNAVEAMEEGGTLTISTRPVEVHEKGPDDGRARGVRIGFRDTGPGIPESDRQKIFTPFYSTKRDGHGLGLALVHRTITDHGGRLHLHSREAVGTEFVIVLPVEEDAS